MSGLGKFAAAAVSPAGWTQSVAALAPSRFPSHSPSFADVRLLPGAFSVQVKDGGD
jgi:hypothetical protein